MQDDNNVPSIPSVVSVDQKNARAVPRQYCTHLILVSWTQSYPNALRLHQFLQASSLAQATPFSNECSTSDIHAKKLSLSDMTQKAHSHL